MVKINIGDKVIGEGEPCFIIAEAGVNHNGSLELAKKLVDAAVEAKADAVKFQLLTAKGLYVKDAGKFKTDLGEEVDIYDIWKGIEIQDSWIPELVGYCNKKGITFLSSVFDERGVDLLEKHVDAYKIASYELTHIPLLKKAAKTGKALIFSIGGANIEEVKEALDAIKAEDNNNIAIMQCVLKYPMPLNLANVNVIGTLKKDFPDIAVGYSDHSLDPTKVPIAAIVKGAKIIEKHFTLSREMEGIDHKMSLEPEELKLMVEAVRTAEKRIKNNEQMDIDKNILGDNDIRLTKEQEKIVNFARRKIFASKNIKKGERFSKKNIAVLRPGNKDVTNGMHPREFLGVLGSIAKQDIAELDIIKKEDIEK